MSRSFSKVRFRKLDVHKFYCKRVYPENTAGYAGSGLFGADGRGYPGGSGRTGSYVGERIRINLYNSALT
jgi:hypothetical protein